MKGERTNPQGARQPRPSNPLRTRERAGHDSGVGLAEAGGGVGASAPPSFLAPIFGSVPARSRAMLALWRQKMSAASTKVKMISDQLNCATSAISGAAAAAQSAASE